MGDRPEAHRVPISSSALMYPMMSPSTKAMPRFTASYIPRSSVETTTRDGYRPTISSVESVEPPSTST